MPPRSRTRSASRFSPCTASDWPTLERITAEIDARFGRIDILIANAGGDVGADGTAGAGGGKPDPDDAVGVSVADVEAVIHPNLTSSILTCKAVAPAMMERRSGWIVTIGSAGALSGRPTSVVYSAAKAAVHEYTRCLAAQLRPFNIPVNCVAPGGNLTPRVLATLETRNITPEALVATDTLERLAHPEETARAVTFLVSDPGPFISGQVIRVDGGRQLWPA